MKPSLSIFAAILLLAAGMRAEEAAAPAPTATVTAALSPTPILPELSKPPVTPDPRFIDENYAKKWPHIDLETTKQLHKRKDVLFLDGRAMVEWEASHIPGALALPTGEFDKEYLKHKKKIMKAKILVAYCHGEGCRQSDFLAQKLVDKGFKNVAVFWGGFPAWTGAQLPLADKTGKLLPTPVPTATVTVTPAL